MANRKVQAGTTRGVALSKGVVLKTGQSAVITAEAFASLTALIAGGTLVDLGSTTESLTDSTTAVAGSSTPPAPRVTSTASTATLTVDANSYDIAALTAQAAALTVAAPTGTPVDGQPLTFRFKDNGTARAISWNAAFRVVGITLPLTTVINKTVYVETIYNTSALKWDAINLRQEA